MIQLKTVRTGDRVAVWNTKGDLRLVDGPRRLILLGKRVEPLARFTAEPDQYLIIKHQDGQKEHIRGPAEV